MARRKPSSNPKNTPTTGGTQVAPASSASSDRSGTFATCLALLVPLVAYLLTLAPSVTGGDAGELVLGAKSAGVLHPPGYPLYALIAHLFTRLPIGELALRVNLFSALTGALAAGVLQRTVSRWSGSPWAGLIATGCFAFSPTVWEHAVAAEVFALNHLFAATLLWLAVAYDQSRTPRWAWAMAGVFGLGMSHHHTLLFLAAPVLLLPFLREPKVWLKPGRMAGLAGLFLLGLLPYASLPLIASGQPAVAWGDFTSLKGLLNHFTRADYGSLQLASGKVATEGAWLARWKSWALAEGRALGWIGLLPVALGLRFALKQPTQRLIAAGLVIIILGYGIVFNGLANLSPADPLIHSVLERFWTLPHLLICLLLGLGFAPLTRLHPQLRMGASIALLLLPIGWHWRTRDQHQVTAFSDYGAAWLSPLPRNAILLARGDLIVNTLTYRQNGTGLRTDVRVLDLERMSYPWEKAYLSKRQPDLVIPAARYGPATAGGYNLGELIRANPSLGPWFVAGDLTPQELACLPGWTLWPHGMGWRLEPPQSPLDLTRWKQENEASLPTFPLNNGPRTSADPWHTLVESDWWESRHRRAVTLLERANGDASTLRLALDLLIEQEQHRPHPPAQLFKNLGIAWQRSQPGEINRAKAAFRNYVNLADPGDRDLPLIREWLKTN